MRPARCASRQVTPRSTTPVPRCSNKPRPPDSARNMAAAWASASRARRSRPRAAPATSAPATPTTIPTPRSSCASTSLSATSNSSFERERTMTITLTESQVDELGRELDAIRARIVADLGADDRDYIYKILKTQRGLEAAGRAALFLGFLPPFWLAGTAALSLSKILDNMEIGHNVMHGQYDWMRDPALNSKIFEWDTACPSDQWRHSHNYMHHTFTNILDKDRDIGYGILRMDENQKWNPYYLGNPVWAFLLMTFFQYGVALHDLEVENVVTGKRKPA